MSTYLEVKNDLDIVQVDDTHKTLKIIREGTLSASYSRGEMCGFALEENECFAVFAVASGVLLCVSPLIYDGKLVYYVSSDGAPISYKTIGYLCSSDKMLHGAGIEVYTDKGELTYSSFFKSMNYVLYKNIPPSSKIWSGTGRDTPESKAQSRLIDNGNYWESYAYNGQSPFVLPQSIPCVHSGSINPFYTGWQGANPNYGAFTCGGFRFTDRNKIEILSPLIEFGAQKIIGVGDFSQLTYRDYHSGSGMNEVNHYSGAMAIYYDFHIFEPI
ncbi:hypothetical protein SELR_pSRC400440 (plasmid) [Selenomonas ruminantium subsp. lactilytica TAM6421]|uniref:Uncharacterized protein n=1 Tax=Selenomonas ruminantium subsp. lactilytica (strain NBRC 103574 / TAM6421) TaxID=927704 RepID=I0GVA8_SELRL|nr:hypothetical protein [Selenomonas ruminantium]BAL84695.1 hypothetical protein SELR_pSRC400440 [Selenomonas ruminantium subsp. lactilytica TAM6421]